MWKHFVRCPFCTSYDVHHSSRRGFVDRCLMPCVLLRPVRCYSCLRRFLQFVLLPAAPRRLAAPARDSKPAVA